MCVAHAHYVVHIGAQGLCHMHISALPGYSTLAVECSFARMQSHSCYNHSDELMSAHACKDQQHGHVMALRCLGTASCGIEDCTPLSFCAQQAQEVLATVCFMRIRLIPSGRAFVWARIQCRKAMVISMLTNSFCPSGRHCLSILIRTVQRIKPNFVFLCAR